MVWSWPLSYCFASTTQNPAVLASVSKMNGFLNKIEGMPVQEQCQEAFQLFKFVCTQLSVKSTTMNEEVMQFGTNLP